MHPRDGVVVVVNVRNGLHQKVAGKVGWPEDWWPTLVEVEGLGRVGALACWEHTQPLLKYHTYLQREELHIAAWPPLDPHPGGPALWSMSKEGQYGLSECTLRITD